MPVFSSTRGLKAVRTPPDFGWVGRFGFRLFSFGPVPWGMRICLSAWLLSASAAKGQDVAGPMFRQLANGQIELSWPADAPWFLEEQAPLSASGSWSPIPEDFVISGDRRIVTIAVTADQRFFRLSGDQPLILAVSSPVPGEGGVSTTRETIFRLSGGLASGVEVTSTNLFAEADGRKILSRIELSSDRRTLTLFPGENFPASAVIRVTLDATGLVDGQGREMDADFDGQPGGARVLEFTTSSASPVAETGVVGHVFAAEPGPGGVSKALRNVTITVDGAEQTLRTTTDATGFFRLSPSPAGRFFVHIDGRTVTDPDPNIHWPGGAYYPVVGKAWNAMAGVPTNGAGGTGIIYLPLIQADALTPAQPNQETVVHVAPSVLATRPELAGVEITLPPNALFADNGARGGKVGIAPVPPDRLPESLPPGLNLPLVITVQTDGPQNFDRPVPARFPNLPDPVSGELLSPGAKSALWSFNHDTGRWELQGPMTVSADGKFVETDPGVGIRQPGWHGSSPGAAAGDGDVGGCGMSASWEPLGSNDEEACEIVSTTGQGRAGYCLTFGRACTLSCTDCIEDQAAFQACVALCNASVARCSARSDICPWSHGPDE